MSNETQKPSPAVAAVPTTQETAPEQKVGFLKKTKQFIVDHKRPVIMTASLVGLVAAAGVIGRKSVPTQELILELETVTDPEPVAEESVDTTVA